MSGLTTAAWLLLFVGFFLLAVCTELAWLRGIYSFASSACVCSAIAEYLS